MPGAPGRVFRPHSAGVARCRSSAPGWPSQCSITIRPMYQKQLPSDEALRGGGRSSSGRYRPRLGRHRVILWRRMREMRRRPGLGHRLLALHLLDECGREAAHEFGAERFESVGALHLRGDPPPRPLELLLQRSDGGGLRLTRRRRRRRRRRAGCPIAAEGERRDAREAACAFAFSRSCSTVRCSSERARSRRAAM